MNSFLYLIYKNLIKFHHVLLGCLRIFDLDTSCTNVKFHFSNSNLLNQEAKLLNVKSEYQFHTWPSHFWCQENELGELWRIREYVFRLKVFSFSLFSLLGKSEERGMLFLDRLGVLIRAKVGGWGNRKYAWEILLQIF